MTNEYAWLYVDGDWDKLIDFCKKEKDHAKRLEFFNEYLNIDGDNLTIKDDASDSDISEVATEAALEWVENTVYWELEAD